MTTKTALVIGATGGIGKPVARLLAARGWAVRALHRDPDHQWGASPITWIKGDALVSEDVARAAHGVSVIVHAMKPRRYRDWQKLMLNARERLQLRPRLVVAVDDRAVGPRC